MEMRFRDRVEAGRMLAGKLRAHANRPDVIVLALPRGRAPVSCDLLGRAAQGITAAPTKSRGEAA